MMAEKLYYCNTCDVHLNGPEPASQHYSGSKHRKKEALKLTQNSTMFAATVDESTIVHSSTDASGARLERQTASLNLTDLSSSHSAHCMRCENTSVETALTCNVVMVPPLDPDLPPVPVTMENALAQTEYEFDGRSGSCHLCGTVFTSQQHAQQHLSGQKHLKTKKLWETRREQLQLTVSGLCPSMKSKPIALCHPLVSDLPSRDSISDIDCKQTCSRSVAAATSAAVPSNIVDGLQWFSCEVCNKKMNTIEMLEFHKRSPAHQKKAERQHSAGASSDNTVWQTCPTCHKKLNSRDQLVIHMNSHSRPTTVSNYPPVSTDSRTTLMTVEPGAQWHLHDRHVNTAGESELSQPSPTHRVTAVHSDTLRSLNIGDNTVWQICPQCNKRVNSLKQLDIHVKSHGVMNDMDTGNQPASTADAQEILRNVNTTLSAAAETISPPIEFADETDVQNSLMFVNQLKVKEETSQTDNVVMSKSAEKNQLRTSETQTVCHQTTSHNKFTSDTATAAAAAAAADDGGGVMVSIKQPLRPACVDNKAPCTSENSCQTDVSSAAVNDVDADAEKLVTDDDLITSGCCVFVGCVYHCELCDVHLSGNEPRNMHLTGAKHISCRQKAQETTLSEYNPFSPRFRYCCQLCNVPFNTLRDKTQHERGQQHMSKSARHVPASDRLMPDVVLPTDTDNESCLPDSLITSTPRSYQQELYHKTLVADSVCFLPTGE